MHKSFTGSRPRRRSRRMQLESLEDRRILAAWEPMGPAPSVNGQVEKITPNNEVIGAIHTLAAHPTEANILYAGGVNGGLWRTRSALDDNPFWEPLTDYLPSLSIGAIDLDPNDPDRIVAGTGRFSAFFQDGGSIGQIYLSDNSGDSWEVIEDPLFFHENISGIQVNGDLILVSTGTVDELGSGLARPLGGLYRSTDAGENWEEIELLPRETTNPENPTRFQAFDLVDDPSDPSVYYVSVQNQGIFRSLNAGETWNDVSAGDTTLDGIITGGGNNNIELAVGTNGRVYAAVVVDGQAQYIGYSDAGGGTWVQMDLPQTPETTGIVGLHPDSAGFINLSITVDPTDPEMVYVGGDRQDGVSLQGNFVGARDATARLFRGDTRVLATGAVPSPQWSHITHSDRVTEIPDGGTRRGSAPHASSREMVFDSLGNLIEGDGGGIYRRTIPFSKKGDWDSLAGNLQVAEIHDIAYDSVSNIIIAGTQDIGAIEQQRSGGDQWQATVLPEVNFRVNANGGDVAVDDTTLGNRSLRYISIEGLGFFRRQLYDSRNNLLDTDLLPVPGSPLFVTPIELNVIDQSDLIVATETGLFESFDRGETFQPVPGPGGIFPGPLTFTGEDSAFAYGGRRHGRINEGVIYAGAGAEVWVRPSADDNINLTRAQFPGGSVRDLTLDPEDWRTAYVIDRDRVYVTRNAGDSWHDITGNLEIAGGAELRSIEFIQKGHTRTVVVGTNADAFAMRAHDPGDWSQFGELPNAPVFDLDYDSRDDVLVAGLLGRGSYKLRNASSGADFPDIASASGIKWNDLNGNGERDPGEPGIPDFIIYVDINDDGQLGIGEPATITRSDGRYALRNVPNGTFPVREFIDPGWVQTFPDGTGEHIVLFDTSREVMNIDFGNVRGTGENEGRDFGDAPAPYPTLLSDDGPSHGIVPGFQLGATIDGELNGIPTDLATGDDLTDLNDEDGVTFVTDVIPGLETLINVEIQNGVQPPGLLQAWIDFDGDGDWTSPGEQVFRNLPVSEGENLLTFTVPVVALQGPTVARFRYGYEPGLSFDGPAVAGEIEDYLVDIVRGGPTANDDTAVVRRNSEDNVLDVTANDSFRPGSGTVISDVTDPPNGSVQIANNGLEVIYTPDFDFDGTDTFRYTLEDDTGETDSANVTVTVLPDLVQFRLATTDLDGNEIDTISLNEQFILRGLVQDLRDVATGVFAAYADVNYPTGSADVQGPIAFGPNYDNGQSGDASIDGLIDEVGAFDGIERLGPDEALLFSVVMRATQEGVLEFETSPADIIPQHNVLLYDMEDEVPTDQIEYRSIEILVGPGIGNPPPLLTNASNSLDVNNDAEITPMDALLVINELNTAAGNFQAARAATAASHYLDVNSDGQLSPLDALLIINRLNEDAAEGERASDGVGAVAAAIHADRSSSRATADEKATDVVSPVMTDASSTAVTLGQRSNVFESIDEMALARDDVDDDMDSVLDLICDDLTKKGL